MLAIDAELHAPPPVEFMWGSRRFKAVVESLTQNFTMFHSQGWPVRATLRVTFKQYRPLSEQLESPKRTSADKTKQRVLTADDSLWAMAAREYEDPSRWRLIARHNRIDNPRLVRAGTVVMLPPLEDLEPEAAGGPA
jgi:nucleoid-associated protein YgaU